jgi:hypothetical protein
LHEDGFDLGSCTRGGEVPPGRLQLFIGEPFSGVRGSVLELELQPGERRTVEPAFEREPTLRVLVPEGHWLVSVEVGRDSITRWVGAKGPEFMTGVPPGSEVVVLAQGPDVRRARRAPWSGEATIDLRSEESVLVPARTGAPFEASYRVRSATGGSLAVEASVTTLGEEPLDLDPSPDLVRVSLPAGARFEVRLSAEGHRALYRTGVAIAGGTSFEDVTLPVALD